jgi:hypothetical protein
MSQMHPNKGDPDDIDQDELERLLLQGVDNSSDESRPPIQDQKTVSPHPFPLHFVEREGVRHTQARDHIIERTRKFPQVEICRGH